MVRQKQKQPAWFRRSVISVSLLAGLAYCSWPLGYYLNPKVSAHGLASELGALGQPYNWVFISGDVATGALVLLIALIVFLRLRKRMQGWQKLALVLFGSFGFLTALDASMPLHCVPSITACPPIANDAWLVLHGAASISAAVCLFLSALIIWYRHRSDHRFIIMQSVIAAYILFGIASVVFFFTPGPGYLSQRYFIILCSIWTTLLPIMYVRPGMLFKQV